MDDSQTHMAYQAVTLLPTGDAYTRQSNPAASSKLSPLGSYMRIFVNEVSEKATAWETHDAG